MSGSDDSKTADVLLIKPYSSLSNVLPPIGLGYLSSSLKRNDITTRIVHCFKDRINIPEIIEIIKRDKIKILGVTSCSNDHFWLARLAEELESLSDVYLIAGGSHPTGLGKRLLGLIPRINFIIRSEGEYAFTRLVKLLLGGEYLEEELRNVPNLVWRSSTGEFKENSIELPRDLDDLELPDWEQLSPEEYARFAPHGGFAKALPVAQLFTTRGCPYSCRYCAATLMNGRQIRKRSPEAVVEEIQYLVKEHGVREFHIEDDNFTFSTDHVVNLCSAIQRKGIRANFGLPNGVRIDRLDKVILKEMKSAGFYFFSIGIESGNPAILKAMKKSLDLEKVREKICLIRQFNFRIKGFFMIGYPGETRKEILETIQFAKSLDLDQAFFSIYIPLPGTPEFQSLEEQGRIDIGNCNWENYYTGDFSEPPYIPDTMTAKELNNLVSRAHLSFYCRPKIIRRMVRDITSITQIKHLLRRGKSLLGIR